MASKSGEEPRSSKDLSNQTGGTGLGEQPPAIVDGEDVILHQVPGIIFDHVIDHQILTETFKKEDRALVKLADLQKSSVQSNPEHLAYKPNPYNKSKFRASNRLLLYNSKFEFDKLSVVSDWYFIS